VELSEPTVIVRKPVYRAELSEERKRTACVLIFAELVVIKDYFMLAMGTYPSPHVPRTETELGVSTPLLVFRGIKLNSAKVWRLS
jgi:hypothetical protein